MGTSLAVHVRVDSDDDANRISAVLEALGYTVLRELGESNGGRLEWACNRIARQYGLTHREQDVLTSVLDGKNNDDIGVAQGISRATVKWHMHNVFAKTETSNRESLLRLALQLRPEGPETARQESTPHATTQETAPEPSDIAVEWAVAEEQTAYDSKEPQANELDSDVLFELMYSTHAGLEARYEAALELASRPAEQLRLVDYVISALRTPPTSSPWVHACVGLAEDLQVIGPIRRQALAAGLMRVAQQLHGTGPREVVWIALGRWATLVPAAELSQIEPFLAPGTDVETMQCAAQCLWNCLAFVPTQPTLPAVESRCRELLAKYLDVDWLSLPFARSLTANLLLAFSTLAPESDLAPMFDQACELDEYFPWQLVRSKVRRMREHVTNHDLPTARLDIIEALLAR